MIHALAELLSVSPKELTTFIMAMSPVLELRGAIPFGFAAGLGLQKTLTIAIIGNLIPIIPILFLLEPVSNYLQKSQLAKRFFDWLFERSRKKAALVERYEMLGLILLVAIPLPATGAWTGCIVASLLKIRLRYAFLAITTGVYIAAAIVTILCSLGKGIFLTCLRFL